MASPGVKRPLEDAAAAAAPPRDRTPEPTAHTALPEHIASHLTPGSPLSSISSTPSKAPDHLFESGDGPGQAGNAADSTSAPPAKRHKLTPAEKEAARVEKERKAQEKAVQQAQKEAEKEAERQRKLEEKKQKDEEKEERKKIKEAEKAAKDHEKSLKEQERKEKQEKRDAEKKARDDEKKAAEEAQAKKERAQSRLTGFFASKKESDPSSPARSRANSIASQEEAPDLVRKSPLKPSKEQLFLPFVVPSYGIVAPYNRFVRDGPALIHARRSMDACLTAGQDSEQQLGHKRSLLDAFSRPAKRARYSALTPLKDIIAEIRGTPSQPVDLTKPSEQPIQALRKALLEIPVKSFRYREDVRPPYIGTCTKNPNRCSIRKLSRKPFMEASTRINYDYDSEAEWEEPEEGEDLVSEGEEDMDEDEGEDMQGFLDDEGAEGVKREQLLGDMEPIQTPLYFENARRSNSPVVRFGEGSLDLSDYRIATLIEKKVWSIDPYSTEYWEPEVKRESASKSSQSTAMAPPRMPLNPISGATNIPPGQAASAQQGGIGGPSKLSSPSAATAPPTAGRTKSGKQHPPLPLDLLAPFKAAIRGSSMLTKVGLVEVLKSQFPGVSKGTVQDTLEQVAERVGAKASEKQWVLKA